MDNLAKSKNQHLRLAILVAVLLTAGLTFAYFKIGLIALILIGIPAPFAYLLWYSRYLKHPIEPSVIVPSFLLSVAGFEFHLIEEYFGQYAAAISRIFGFPWTESSFFVVVFTLSGALMLVAVGLYYQKEIAGFIAIMFLVTRIAEVALFIFPFIKPIVEPDLATTVSQNISGTFVANMPSYYYQTTGVYYFPGIYTVVLPLIPALVTLYQIWKFKASKTNYE